MSPKATFILLFFAALSVFAVPVVHAVLTCSITTICNSPDVVVFRLASTSNSHAELPTQSNYANLVCCSIGGAGLGNTCTGTFATILKLSSSTNAHVEQNTFSNYATSSCLSLSGGTVSVGYQASNCTGFDTTVASMSTGTNAHVGGTSVYTTKICATAATAGTVSCSTDATTVAFGTLTAGGIATAAPNASTTMTCDGGTGCTLYVRDANTGLATSSPAYTIASATTTLVAGTEGYGINATTTSAGSGATLSMNLTYGTAKWNTNQVGGLKTTNVTLTSSTAAITSRETVVQHRAAVSPTTLAASYADTITYECLGN